MVVTYNQNNRVGCLGCCFCSFKIAAIVVQHLRLVLERGLNPFKRGDHVSGASVTGAIIASVGRVGQPADHGYCLQILQW